MDRFVNMQDVVDALVEKGQSSQRYGIGEDWELNLSEILEALQSVPDADVEDEIERLSELTESYGDTITKLCRVIAENPIK